jgi:hypothetical protein
MSMIHNTEQEQHPGRLRLDVPQASLDKNTLKQQSSPPDLSPREGPFVPSRLIYNLYIKKARIEAGRRVDTAFAIRV